MVDRMERRTTRLRRPQGPPRRRPILCVLALCSSLLLLLLPRGVRASTSVPHDSTEYEHCKATHRCPRAYSSYDLTAARHSFESAAYSGGASDHASVFSDWESWRVGSHGWAEAGENLQRLHAATRGAHFNSFDFALLGPLYLPDSSAALLFNTTDATLRVDVLGSASETRLGVVSATSEGTEVGLFNFDQLHLGPDVDVAVVGSRALVLVSRSSLVLDTALVAAPGTVGGFPGGLDAGANCLNGPGSGSVRVYLHTVTTSAADVDADDHDDWGARADAGRGLRRRVPGRHDAPHIAHDASPEQARVHLAPCRPALCNAFRSLRSP